MKRKMQIILILSVTAIGDSIIFDRSDDKGYSVIGSDQIADILSTLALTTKSNYEKIRTWEGRIINETTYTIRDERVADHIKTFTDVEPNNLPNEVQRFSCVTIEFKINIENNKFFSFLNNDAPYVYLIPNKKTPYISQTGPEELIQIVTSEYQINISPLSKTKDHVILSRMVRKEPVKPTHRTDPRKAFYIGEKTLWLTLSQFSQMLQMSNMEKYGIVMKEKSEGDAILYRIEIAMPGKSQPFFVFVLNSQAGFNCTYLENRYEQDGSLRSITTIEYVDCQGVFLPKKWEMSQYYPDGGLMRQESCIIEKQQINRTITDNTFSALTYLKDGDIYQDTIQNKMYEVKTGKLVETTKK